MKQREYITRKLRDYIVEAYSEKYDIRMWDKAETPVPREVLLEEVQYADALFSTISEQINRELFEAGKKLKIVSNLAVGFDNIDLDVAREYGVPVTNTPDVLTETTADLTFALLMATARRLIEGYERIQKNKWDNWAPFMLAGTDIHHKTIGIVGMGRIGEAADFVISLLPLTEETKGKFNKEVFHKMKKTAIFINASRGGVVNEIDLYEALVEGEIQAAGLDVFASEPIKNDHPLATLKNVVALPHIGSASVDTREKMIDLCFKNIDAV